MGGFNTLEVEAVPRRRSRRQAGLAAVAAAVWVASMALFVGQGEARASVPATSGKDATYEIRTCDGGSMKITAPEYESLKLHNAARKGAGLGFLCLNPTLTKVARVHSGDMLRRGYFSHYSPENTSPIHRMEAAGYSGWTLWGENIAWGSGDRADSRQIFATLMNSPEHRDNILKDGFQEIGIGAAGGPFDGYRDAGMYTMDFGSRQGQPHDYPDVLSGSGNGDGTTGPVAPSQPNPDAPAEGAVGPEVGPVAGGESPGDAGSQHSKNVAGAEEAVCNVFARTRENAIGELKAPVPGRASGTDDPATRIISQTRDDIAGQFEKNFLSPPFCGFDETSGRAGDQQGS